MEIQKIRCDRLAWTAHELRSCSSHVWTTKSHRKIQDAILSKHEVYVSFRSIGGQLKKLGYSSQGNKKMLQVGEPHPDRNEQFEFINDMRQPWEQSRASFVLLYIKKLARQTVECNSSVG